MQEIYLDHSATTPIRPEVLEAMLPFLREHHGNAGSLHRFGRDCRRAVETAREQVAALINAEPREILFTSGGTESDNLAIRGIVEATDRKAIRLVTTAVEHHAVLHVCESLARANRVDLQVAGVDQEGLVDPDAVEALLGDETVLVSVMHANNETGVVQPLERIGALCRERGIPFHSDTVQSAGKLPLDVRKLPLDLAAISGHKLYGPKGIGALFVRSGTGIEPQAVGGAQERGRRAGTENVAGIVGLGRACELLSGELQSTSKQMEVLRDRLQEGALATVPDAGINGSTAHRLPNSLNMAFNDLDGERMMFALDQEGIAVSTGSACTAGSLDPSHVLLAMGQSHEHASSAIRFSLGRDNTEEEIDRVISLLPGLVEQLHERPD
ncbi:MAG TPA: aminotransferase class V-fold PLP-dependent enzyme [Verrucomicrobia bacterium]|jgi:cysteine desulfurase|nr:aminotransferase class V-fold PLP-dependent enzyme [Verrucomicrobiota bacterium]